MRKIFTILAATAALTGATLAPAHAAPADTTSTTSCVDNHPFGYKNLKNCLTYDTHENAAGNVVIDLITYSTGKACPTVTPGHGRAITSAIISVPGEEDLILFEKQGCQAVAYTATPKYVVPHGTDITVEAIVERVAPEKSTLVRVITTIP